MLATQHTNGVVLSCISMRPPLRWFALPARLVGFSGLQMVFNREGTALPRGLRDILRESTDVGSWHQRNEQRSSLVRSSLGPKNTGKTKICVRPYWLFWILLHLYIYLTALTHTTDTLQGQWAAQSDKGSLDCFRRALVDEASPL